MADDMISIPQRVNDLEKSNYSHEHRIKQLEGLPNRVSELESRLAGMDARLTHIEQSTLRIEGKQETISNSQQQLMLNNTELATQQKTSARNLGILVSALTIISLVAGFFFQ